MGLLQNALEGYREPDSTFSCGGKLYNLTTMLEDTNKLPTIKIPVSKLDWMIEHGDPDEVRVDEADLSAPCLVTHWEGKLAVIDGFHRLTKAVRQGKRELPCKMVSDKIMAKHYIRDLQS